MSSLHGPIKFPPGFKMTNMNSSPCAAALCLSFMHKHNISQPRFFTKSEGSEWGHYSFVCLTGKLINSTPWKSPSVSLCLALIVDSCSVTFRSSCQRGPEPGPWSATVLHSQIHSNLTDLKCMIKVLRSLYWQQWNCPVYFF